MEVNHASLLTLQEMRIITSDSTMQSTMSRIKRMTVTIDRTSLKVAWYDNDPEEPASPNVTYIYPGNYTTWREGHLAIGGLLGEMKLLCHLM